MNNNIAMQMENKRSSVVRANCFRVLVETQITPDLFLDGHCDKDKVRLHQNKETTTTRLDKISKWKTIHDTALKGAK